jgi:hypothetical protein
MVGCFGGEGRFAGIEFRASSMLSMQSIIELHLNPNDIYRLYNNLALAFLNKICGIFIIFKQDAHRFLD